MTIRYKLTRYNIDQDNGATHGILSVDTSGRGHYSFRCYTLEDLPRDIKIPGVTAIPDGVYRIQKREVLSPMTKKYRKRYDWFDWHVEVKHVTGFTYIYMHIGNRPGDTDGCVLLGTTPTDDGRIARSAYAFEHVYKEITYFLNDGFDVELEICYV